MDDGSFVQSTPRDIKGHWYYDAARQKALDYRKANPELKWRQNLTPEAGNRPVTVQRTQMGRTERGAPEPLENNIGGQVDFWVQEERSPELAQKWDKSEKLRQELIAAGDTAWEYADEAQFDEARAAELNSIYDKKRQAYMELAPDGRADWPQNDIARIIRPATEIRYNPGYLNPDNNFRTIYDDNRTAEEAAQDDFHHQQFGGDIISHEATHVMQTPAEGETQNIPHTELTNPYHQQRSEQEAYISSAKRWFHQETGQIPETPEEIDEAIEQYRQSYPGSQNDVPWDDPAYRKKVHEIWPGVVSNQIQDATKYAAVQGLFAGMQKMAAKLPYRERVELYARDPRGRIFSGLYSNDRTPGVPGGGVDEGEDPTESAAREFKEEVGHLVRDVQMLDVPSFDQAWNPPYMNKKQKERAKRYSGSRTRFATGVYDPAQKETPSEPWDSKYIMPRKPSTMLKGLNLSHDDPDTADRMAARKRAVEEVIRLLSEKTASTPDVQNKTKTAAVQGLFAGPVPKTAANLPAPVSAPDAPVSVPDKPVYDLQQDRAIKNIEPEYHFPNAEQIAAKMKPGTPATFYSTARQLKTPEYVNAARQKALDYRKANPDLKWEQQLDDEAFDRRLRINYTGEESGPRPWSGLSQLSG